MNVGQNVKRIREEQRYTQTEIARRCGVTPAAISGLEHGDFTPSTALLVKIARALEVEPGELLKEAAPLADAPPTEPEEVHEVRIEAFGSGEGGGFAALSVNDALSQLRILAADWERGELTDEALVEGVGEIHKRLQQAVSSR